MKKLIFTILLLFMCSITQAQRIEKTHLAVLNRATNNTTLQTNASTDADSFLIQFLYGSDSMFTGNFDLTVKFDSIPGVQNLALDSPMYMLGKLPAIGVKWCYWDMDLNVIKYPPDTAGTAGNGFFWLSESLIAINQRITFALSDSMHATKAVKVVTFRNDDSLNTARINSRSRANLEIKFAGH